MQLGCQFMDAAHFPLNQRLTFAWSSVLTTNFAAGSGLSRQAQTRERGANRSSTDVRHNDPFKNGDSRECNLKFLNLADCVRRTEIPLLPHNFSKRSADQRNTNSCVRSVFAFSRTSKMRLRLCG